MANNTALVLEEGKILQDVRRLVDSTEGPDSDTALPFLRFLDKYVSCVPGQRDIAKFFKENPRKTLLDKLTPSDIAYTVLIYENTYAVWDENRLWKTMTRAEREETPRVQKQKYFQKCGSKNKKFQDGWTKEGEKYYESLVEEFRSLSKNEVVWEGLQEHWRQYCKEHNKYYYENGDDRHVDNDGSEDEYEEDYVMDLPDMPEDIVGGASGLLSLNMRG